MGVVIVAALTYMYFEDFACVLLIRVYICICVMFTILCRNLDFFSLEMHLLEISVMKCGCLPSVLFILLIFRCRIYHTAGCLNSMVGNCFV